MALTTMIWSVLSALMKIKCCRLMEYKQLEALEL